MFSAIVEQGFTARHSVLMPDGQWEEPHSHDWRVRAHFQRQQLDEFGMVVDFVAASNALNEVLRPLEGANLNTAPELTPRIPTAEIIAHWIFCRLRDAGWSTLSKIELTEAPGCVAVFEERTH